MTCIVVTNISIHRVKADFATVAKNDEQRQGLIDASSKLASVNTKIETSSNLVAFQIASVLVKVQTLKGTETVDAEWVFDEITRVTVEELLQVLPRATGMSFYLGSSHLVRNFAFSMSLE